MSDLDTHILWATRQHMGIQPKQASWMVQKIPKAYAYFIEAGIHEDEVLSMRTYSISKMYKQIGADLNKVGWRRLVWSNYGAPKWKFILFLALHRRLLSKARLAKWNGVNWALAHMKGKNSKGQIYRMTLASSVYYGWKERNCRLFQGKTRNR